MYGREAQKNREMFISQDICSKEWRKSVVKHLDRDPVFFLFHFKASFLKKKTYRCGCSPKTLEFVLIWYLPEVWGGEQRPFFKKSAGRMEVKPIKDQSLCSQALRGNCCLWSPPFCGQDGELPLAAVDLCLLCREGTFLKGNFIHYSNTALGKNTSNLA